MTMTKMRRAATLSAVRWAATAVGILCATFTTVAQSSAGCAQGPYTSCLNPVPATYLSGSWIESDSASEWQITADAGQALTFNPVTGWTAGFTPPSSIIVFPIAFGCPSVFYTVAANFSSYVPSAIVTGTTGNTTFQWKAIDPTPNTPCGGYTPVASQTFNGSIANKGNETGSGTWTNSSGGTGPLSILSNQGMTPRSLSEIDCEFFEGSRTFPLANVSE